MPKTQKNSSARRLTAACFFLLTSALCLWSQEATAGRSPVATADSRFATLNTSLEQTADVVLASAAQAGIAAESGSKETHATVPVLRSEGGLRPSPANAVDSRMTFLQPVIDPILREVGIPEEMAAVVLVESGGDPMALSPKGARGIWQLMPDTARRYGLTVDASQDDRLDIEKSTRAAARYLRDLHAEFGSWPLALAAYNTGEQNLQRAIDRSRSTDFTALNSLRLLPFETRQYVPAVFSAITRLTKSPGMEQISAQRENAGGAVFAVAERNN